MPAATSVRPSVTQTPCARAALAIRPTASRGVRASRVTDVLMRTISTIEITVMIRPIRMSLIQITNSGISITSLRKRLMASPGESGKGEAPGRLRIYFNRFLRSRVEMSAASRG